MTARTPLSPGWRLATLVALGVTLLALIGDQYALYLLSAGGFEEDVFLRRFVAMWAVEGLFFLCAASMVRTEMPRGALAIVLVFGVLLRVVPLVAPNFLSTDLNRYVWDGHVQNAGVNPYCCVPSAPELNELRSAPIFRNINRAGYAPTIYPPAAQMLFAAVAAFSETAFAMKLAMALCDIVSIACMVVLLGRAGLPRSRVLIYAWNPVVLWEYAGNGHVDAAATAWLALALLAASSARVWLRIAGAGLGLAGATLTKFLPIVVTPAFWRRDMRLPLVFVVAVAAGYGCYASVGWKVFGFLGGYAREEGMAGGGGVYWLRLLGHAVPLPVWAGTAWLGLTALILGALALAVTLRAPRTNSPATTSVQALVLAMTLMVMLTPHYAWYFGVIAFLACLAPLSSALWLSVACVVLYMDAVHDRIGWESVLYLPFLVLAARDVVRMQRKA